MKKYGIKCNRCSTEDKTLLYRSGKMPSCYDCQNYANLQKKSEPSVLGFTREEFLSWKRAQLRQCFYCGIEEKDIYGVKVINVRTKKVMESIGVDRASNDQDYHFENMVLCCGPCNGIKSGMLTKEEMLLLGPVLRQIWQERLDASIDLIEV